MDISPFDDIDWNSFLNEPPEQESSQDSFQAFPATAFDGGRVDAPQTVAGLSQLDGRQTYPIWDSVALPIGGQPMDGPLVALHDAGGHGFSGIKGAEPQYDSISSEPMPVHCGGQDIHCGYPACGMTFSRIDSLRRHILGHTGSGKTFQCPHCLKYQGAGAFLRKDKLTDHLRQYHRIGGGPTVPNTVSCRHPDCLTSISNGFVSNAILHKHIRKVHKQTPFQCPIVGCDKVGAKGWFRKQDRIKHQRAAHADVDQQELTMLNSGMDSFTPEYLKQE